jgi:divalent metal cation (Fe/Co/Zn/Cd) transporter
VTESHRIVDTLEKTIERRFPHARVTIHVDPQHDQ